MLLKFPIIRSGISPITVWRKILMGDEFDKFLAIHQNFTRQIFLTPIHQNFPLSKFCAIQYSHNYSLESVE